MNDDDFAFHPLQYAMTDCIRDQLEKIAENDSARLGGYILRDLSVDQLRAVILFVESFDINNLPEE